MMAESNEPNDSQLPVQSSEERCVHRGIYDNDAERTLFSVPISPATSSMAPILEFLSVNIVDTERRMNESLSLKDYYTVYLVETRVTKEGFIPAPSKSGSKPLLQFSSVWRRFREFEWLRSYLELHHPEILVPPLPEKKATFPWTMTPGDNFDAGFVERRRLSLESFLMRIGNHPVLSNDPGFLDFLQDENLDCSGRDIWDKADTKLKYLTAALRLHEPNKTYEELRNYSVDLSSNLGTILGTRAKLAERRFGIHKLHGNYGRIFSEWSGIEKELGDSLQTSGHHMDNYASWIEGCLEEEESVCDLIKEYFFYADSLKALCDRQAVAQFEAERAEEHRLSKCREKEAVAAGKNPSGFLSKFLLGSGYTDDEKEARLHQLDREIEEAGKQKELEEQNLHKFLGAAEKELQAFKKQKTKDLNAALVQYARIQLDIARKGLKTWTAVQETLERA